MMIHLENINKTYFGAQPLHVLKGINLDIEEGEFVSIMGATAKAITANAKIITPPIDTPIFFGLAI